MERRIKLTEQHCIDIGAILRAERQSRALKLDHFEKAFPDRKPKEIETSSITINREIEALDSLLEQIGQ